MEKNEEGVGGLTKKIDAKGGGRYDGTCNATAASVVIDSTSST